MPCCADLGNTSSLKIWIACRATPVSESKPEQSHARPHAQLEGIPPIHKCWDCQFHLTALVHARHRTTKPLVAWPRLPSRPFCLSNPHTLHRTLTLILTPHTTSPRSLRRFGLLIVSLSLHPSRATSTSSSFLFHHTSYFFSAFSLLLGSHPLRGRQHST